MPNLFMKIFTVIVIYAVCAEMLFAAPHIVCKEPEYDFGSVYNDQKINHTFEIYNEGDSVLQIGSIRECCGGNASISAKTIAPEEKATFTVCQSLIGRKGKLTRKFFIASDDPKTPYYCVSLTGTAIPLVDIEPSHVNFGNITEHTSLEQEVVLKTASDMIFNITNITSSAVNFSFELQPPGDSRTHKLLVRTKPPMPQGVTRGSITLFTDHSRIKQVTIRMIAIVSSDIIVVPTKLLLKEGGDEPVTRYIAVRSRVKKPFRIKNIELPDKSIEVTIDPIGDNGYKCEFRNIVIFPELDGMNVILQLEHEDIKEIIIPVSITDDNSDGAISTTPGESL